MYNVRLIKYVTGNQIRMYDRVYGVPYPEEGSKEKPETEYNPFTDKEEKMRTVEDLERSKAVSRTRTVNRLYYLTRSNIWDWFVTLTFNPDRVDSMDYDECVRRLSVWLNNCKKKCPEMKYIVVPEKHESGRYHFHGLFSGCEGLGFVQSGHYTETGEIIYNIGSYRMGWTTATRVTDSTRVARYVTKYISKDLCSVTPGKRRYWASRNIQEAEIVDIIVEGKDREGFLKSFADSVTYAKTVQTPIVTTNYYELNSEYKTEGVEQDGKNYRKG